ncbi:MAG: PA2778 family cysteine peptidase [Burkholderiaceae bacterium]|nr:PA2778 family cysteine peptidase [Burkholderiaceae bacterium]
MERSRRAWLFGAGMGCLSGCAVFAEPPQSAALAAAPPAGLPLRTELRAVPFFPQTPYHCGPAALATVLVHAGLAATPEQLADAVFLPTRAGALQAEMLAAARRFGALAVPLPPQLSALFVEVAAGHAVLLLQNLGLAIAPRWHYAVLVGYDLAARELVLRSGTTERERMGFALFERTWARAAHWAFVALPPGQLPVTAGEVDAVQAAIAFERVAAAAQALRAYDGLVARWPGNALAGLGQGNARATVGDLGGAASAFERVATQHDHAAAWHNLGAVLLRQGRRAQAQTAAARAVARASAAEPQWLQASHALLALTQADRP